MRYRLGYLALDKKLIYPIKYRYFSYFWMKTYVVGAHWNHLSKGIPMGTHNMCFRPEIRKLFLWGPSLLRAMVYNIFIKMEIMVLVIRQTAIQI